KNEFDVFGVLTLLVTLTVAFLVQYIAQERSGDIRMQKNLLIEDIKECLSILRDLRGRFLACYYQGTVSTIDERVIKGTLKNLSNSLFTLEEEMSHCRVKIHNTDFGTIKDEYFDYKRAITG